MMRRWKAYLKTTPEQEDEAAGMIASLLQIAAGLCWLSAAVEVAWFFRAGFPTWLQPSILVHHVLLGTTQRLSGAETVVRVAGLVLSAAIYDRVARIAAHCGRGLVFTRVNVVALQAIGWLSIARQVVEALGLSLLDAAFGLPVPVHPEVSHNVGSLSTTVLPFVIAWIFQRGVKIQEELDDVV